MGNLGNDCPCEWASVSFDRRHRHQTATWIPGTQQTHFISGRVGGFAKELTNKGQATIGKYMCNFPTGRSVSRKTLPKDFNVRTETPDCLIIR